MPIILYPKHQTYFHYVIIQFKLEMEPILPEIIGSLN